jgi:hypothetical protein
MTNPFKELPEDIKYSTTPGTLRSLFRGFRLVLRDIWKFLIGLEDDLRNNVPIFYKIFVGPALLLCSLFLWNVIFDSTTGVFNLICAGYLAGIFTPLGLMFTYGLPWWMSSVLKELVARGRKDLESD